MLRLLDTHELSLLRVGAAPAAVVAPVPPAVRTVRPSLGWRVRNRLLMLRNGSVFVPLLARLARRLGLLAGYGELRLRKIGPDGTVTDYGVVCRRLVTTAGVAALASTFDNTTEPEVFKYHGFGTGSTAESAADTALVTELTTQYAVSGTRPTGSQAHSTNTYTTVGTLSPSSTVTITEQGIFSVATGGSGTLLDRSVFTGIALTGGADSLQATYTLSLPSGG